MEHIYRFRSIDNLLDRFNELDNQEIYFASPDELNDPVEGFKDLYWDGDSIVWKNFFKNYIRCLEHVFFLYLVLNDERQLNSLDIPIISKPMTYPSSEHKDLFQKILKTFFSNNFLKSLPKNLENRNDFIRKNELLSYLKFIHLFAIEIISDTYREFGILPHKTFNKSILKDLSNKLEDMGGLISLINNLGESSNNSIEHLFKQVAFVEHQMDLMNNEGDSNSNRFFIYKEFPNKFIQQLEKLVHPNWFSASFLSECTNSSVWGHYAQNHKGVCLIFNIEQQDGKSYLDLKQKIVTRNELTYTQEERHVLKKVEYENKYISIDFFRSIARDSTIKIRHEWYLDEFGNKSKCGEHLDDKNRDSWHQQYYKDFQKIITTKLDDWKYEHEYRLIIDDFFHLYKTQSERIFTYNFEALKGIIFGIRTSDSDKVRIIKIIEQKCKKYNRDNFEFYQAYYSPNTGQILKEKLDLLKFK